MLTQQIVLEALKSVKYPGYIRDIVSFGLVKNVAVNWRRGGRIVAIDGRDGRDRRANQGRSGKSRARSAGRGENPC